MVAVRSRKFQVQFGLMLATAFSLSTLPAAGQGYTPEQQQACTPDAMRLCGDYVPNVDRITACMIQKRSQLSAQCKVYFRPDSPPESGPTNTTGQPLRIKPLPPRKPVTAKAKKPKTPKPAAT
jgi:hypothetical protein